MRLGASYRLTRDPCSTWFPLWETDWGLHLTVPHCFSMHMRSPGGPVSEGLGCA